MYTELSLHDYPVLSETCLSYILSLFTFELFAKFSFLSLALSFLAFSLFEILFVSFSGQVAYEILAVRTCNLELFSVSKFEIFSRDWLDIVYPNGKEIFFLKFSYKKLKSGKFFLIFENEGLVSGF